MPQYFAPPSTDFEDYQQAVASASVDQSLRTPAQAATAFGDQTRKLFSWVSDPLNGQALRASQGLQPDQAFMDANPGWNTSGYITADQANATYGGGLVRFNHATTPEDAARTLAAARAQQVRDEIFAATKPNPLMDFAGRMAGGFFDPTNLALMWATGPLGEGAATSLGLKGAAETAAVTAKLGKFANAGAASLALGRTAAEGAVVNAPFVAASGGLNLLEGDDYSAGDAMRDIAFGAAFHTGLHVLGLGAKAAKAKLPGGVPASEFGDVAAPTRPTAAPDAAEEFVPPHSVPDAVSALSPTARMGAFLKALDEVAGDETVSVGKLVQRELEGPDISRLDETSAEPAIASFRPLAESEAVTPRGWAFPVREGVAELSDLTTPLDAHLNANSAYPQELRRFGDDSAGAQAQRFGELDPKAAIEQAPIVSPDGMVEHGGATAENLRRLAAEDAPAWRRYRAELAARGIDTAGMTAPVAVRMRAQAMTGSQRAGLSRQMAAQLGERPEPPPAGEAPEMNEARQIYANLNGKLARGDVEAFDLRAPGRAADAAPGPRQVIDMRPDERDVAEGQAGRAAATGDSFIAGDPELKALAADNERLAAESGVELAATEKEAPDAVAKAVRAAAICVAAAAEEIF